MARVAVAKDTLAMEGPLDADMALLATRLLEVRCALVAYLRCLLTAPGSDLMLPCAARDVDGDARNTLTLLLLRDALQQGVEDLWGALEDAGRALEAPEGPGRVQMLVFFVENVLALLFVSLSRHGRVDDARFGTERVRFV